MRKVYLILFSLLAIHLFLLFNLRFTAWPEMLSYPYLRNHGFLLYRDLIHPYPPVLTMGLSILFKFFGYHLWVLKITTWIVILMSDILIYSLIKKVSGQTLGSLVGLFFYVLLQPFLEGNMLWFDLAIVPLVLLGVLFFLNERYFWAGTMVGVAALTKQTVGLFLMFAGLWLIVRERNFKKIFLLAVSPVLLGLTLGVRLITEQSLTGFLNWVLLFPFKYWSQFPGYVQLGLSTRQALVLVLLLLPLVLGAWKLKSRLLKEKNLFFLGLLLLISLVLIYPRFSFFHFQLALAFLAVIFGFLLTKAKVAPLILIAYLGLLLGVVIQPVWAREWRSETRFWDKESLELASLIQKQTQKEDKIYLLGPYSSLYVFADRLPPKPWTDNFGWYFEIPGVQEGTIARWQADPPKYIFWQEPKAGNWFDLATYQPQQITAWIKSNYLQKDLAWKGVWLWQKK